MSKSVGGIFEGGTFKFVVFPAAAIAVVGAAALCSGGFGASMTEGAKFLPKDQGTKPGGDRPAATASPFPSHSAAPKKTGSSTKESTKPKSTPTTQETLGAAATVDLKSAVFGFADGVSNGKIITVKFPKDSVEYLSGDKAKAREDQLVTDAMQKQTGEAAVNACVAWASPDVANFEPIYTKQTAELLEALKQNKPLKSQGITLSGVKTGSANSCGQIVDDYVDAHPDYRIAFPVG